MAQIHLQILTPEREVINEEVDMVSIPAPRGPLGIYPAHADLMSKVSPGELVIRRGREEAHLAVGGGLVQVHRNNVKVMIDLAKKPEEIDEKEVEEARQRAQDALSQQLSGDEYAVTLAALERLTAQLRVKRRTHR